jgi:uncharacterized membrane protein YciS (DUF1049 family)
MKRLITLLLFLVAFVVVGALAFRNGHAVPFDGLIWHGEVALIWLLIAAFALGMAVALLLISPILVTQRWRLWRARREAARLQQTQLVTDVS